MAQADYYRILTQGERSIQCIEENGEVVMVTEFRKTDGGSRQGHVVIKVGHLATVNARVCKSQILQNSALRRLIRSHSSVFASYHLSSRVETSTERVKCLFQEYNTRTMQSVSQLQSVTKLVP